MPDPRAPDYNQTAAAEIIKSSADYQGSCVRPFSTSHSAMTRLRARSMRVNIPCLVSGLDVNADVLLDRFAKPHAVLFATLPVSAGRRQCAAISSAPCVIIDKLPFAVPSDPIVAARTRFIDDNGGKSFFDYSVPQAVITLKQESGG
jgi:ATP-dependent DNA helicase DinG